VVVHPNNPTGHATKAAERLRLEEICFRHGLALIVDEVFLDYPLEGVVAHSFAAGESAALTFVLSGLSKVCALPQMKCSWIVTCGPSAAVDAAMGRLEIIADTFLSMNAPAQLALPVWLGGRQAIVGQITERVLENLAVIDQRTIALIPVEAGWSAILRFPQSAGSDVAERLVREAGVVVHPGSFYGIADLRCVVVSLIVLPGMFRVGLEKLNRWVEPKELT